MSIMNSFATEAAATDTVLNPVPTAAIETDNLNTERVLSLLGLTTDVEPIATTDRKDFLEIVFDDENECESTTVEKDGVEYRFSRTQRNVEVTPERNYGWARFSAKCTIVHFVKNGALIGQTAILTDVRCAREAYNLVKWGVVEVCNDRVKFL